MIIKLLASSEEWGQDDAAGKFFNSHSNIGDIHERTRYFEFIHLYIFTQCVDVNIWSCFLSHLLENSLKALPAYLSEIIPKQLF